MTCGDLSKQVTIRTQWRQRHREFDFDEFIANLICVSDDGKKIITWYDESVVDRIIREKNLYALRK